MLERFFKIVKKLLIYGATVMVVLPVSFFLVLASAPKAQAAEKTATPTPAKESPAVVSKISLPSLRLAKGFSKNMTYRQGERINVAFMFDNVILNSWAKIGSLDPNFPATIKVRAEGNGWHLTTPYLTSQLNLGSQKIEIYAQNPAGTSTFVFPLTLEQKIITIAHTYAIAEDEILLAWNPIQGAQSYLVEWSIQGEKNFLLKKIEGKTRITLSNLTAGTVYEIRITPIGAKGALGEPKPINLKTLGIAPKKEVAGEETQVPKTVTPAIGTGVSTAAPKVAQKATPQEQPTPTPQTSPQNEAKTGWSRILVALAILIIAAGAAIGGYYGYEWYAGKSRDNEPPASKSSSRW